MGIKIDPEKCVMCGNCIPSCPFNALDVDDDKIISEGRL